MTKDRKFKAEYAQELMKVALADLDTAKVLVKGEVERKENIFFHIQQAVEKSLKALLCAWGKPVPLTHDLTLIFDRISNAGPSLPFGDELVDLTPFATIRRYEVGYEEYEDEEIQTVLDHAEKVLDWCNQEVSSHIDKKRS